jgi:hypothetical protein
MMIEVSGSRAGSGSIPLTCGSGSGWPKTRGSGFGSGSGTLLKSGPYLQVWIAEQPERRRERSAPCAGAPRLRPLPAPGRTPTPPIATTGRSRETTQGHWADMRSVLLAEKKMGILFVRKGIKASWLRRLQARFFTRVEK